MRDESDEEDGETTSMPYGDLEGSHCPAMMKVQVFGVTIKYDHIAGG